MLEATYNPVTPTGHSPEPVQIPITPVRALTTEPLTAKITPMARVVNEFRHELLRPVAGIVSARSASAGSRHRYGRSRFGEADDVSAGTAPAKFPRSGFFPLTERRNSEWHVSGLLPLRSRLSAGPGHPAVNRDSAIGLGTTQNTRRLRSRMSGGFWPTLLANETPRDILARSEYPPPRSRLGVRLLASGPP